MILYLGRGNSSGVGGSQVLAGAAFVLILVEAIAGPQVLTPGHIVNTSNTGHMVGIIASVLSAVAFALSLKK
jgi:hypothetical protein